MKVTFANGAEFDTSAPREQKITSTAGEGWVMNLVIRGKFTSESLNEVLNVQNISELVFSTGEDEQIFKGYNAINHAALYYDEKSLAATAEIQLAK